MSSDIENVFIIIILYCCCCEHFKGLKQKVFRCKNK